MAGAMSRRDEALWSWLSNSEAAALGSAVRQVVGASNGKNVHVTFETIFVESGHPFDVLEAASVLASEQICIENVRALRLADVEGAWLLVAFKTRHEGVYHLMGTVPTSHKRWTKVERWLAATRGISRCFLDHTDFSSIGDRLSEFGDVEVVKMSGRVTKDGSSVNRGFPALGLELRPTHIDVINEAESRSATVRTLTLHVRDVLNLHIRRVAGATYYSGDFKLFEQLVLSRLEDAAYKRRELLTGRERRSRKPVQPITLHLEPATLSDADATGELLAVAYAMRDTSLAVFHRNPYLHFTLTDEFDGSNFDVMVTRSDSIDIYPGYKASMDSLARVALGISERFGATAIGDMPVSPIVSIADLAELG